MVVFIIFFLIFPKKVSAQVVINEFVPDSSQEWIEFHNASDSADYLKSYYIDDDTSFTEDSGSSAKKLLKDLITLNPTFPTVDTSSFLNNSGDYVVLFDQNGTLLDQYQFTSNPGRDISIGRFPDGVGGFSILAYATKADANTQPLTPKPTPTPEETVIPTPTPTQTFPSQSSIPTPKLTPFKTVTPGTTPTTSDSVTTSEVLSESESIHEDIESLETEKQQSKPTLPFVLIAVGISFIGFAIFSIIKNAKKDSEAL